jgi:hypothetical protein
MLLAPDSPQRSWLESYRFLRGEDSTLDPTFMSSGTYTAATGRLISW